MVGLGALSAGAAAATGTGAFSAAFIGGRTANIQVSGDANALLALQPGYDVGTGDSTVSDEMVYYESESAEQLAIDISSDDGNGVNVNSTYQIGAIAGDTKDVLDDQTAVAADDVIYGQEPNQYLPDATTASDPAFGITNNSENDVIAQLNWDGTVPEGVKAAMVVDGDSSDLGDGSAAQFGLDLVSDQPDSETTFGINSGSTAYVSIIIVVESDVDAQDITGTLELRSEGAVVQSSS